MTPERSTYQISSDRMNELLSKERQLFAIADAWNGKKTGNPFAASAVKNFNPELATRLDAIIKEVNPTEPMCVYCGWSGEGLAEHEQNCQPAWAVLYD